MYPRRVVCLTEDTTETLCLLGEGDRVVGVSGYPVRPREMRRTTEYEAGRLHCPRYLTARDCRN